AGASVVRYHKLRGSDVRTSIREPDMDLVGLGDAIATTASEVARTSVLGVAMADNIRVMLEIGPRGKKVVAVAPDWPGLERGATTGEAAIDRLQSYLPRYAKVARLAGMDTDFAAVTTVDVVERYPGTGSTDFWGISFAFSRIDRQEVSSEELERELTLMR